MDDKWPSLSILGLLRLRLRLGAVAAVCTV